MLTCYFASVLLATAVVCSPQADLVIDPTKQLIESSVQVGNTAVKTALAPAQWVLMPDGFGGLHLINIVAQDPVKEILPFRGERDVKLLLYTRSNPDKPHAITMRVIPPTFNGMNPTRVVIHGWNAAASSMDHFRKAYLATGNDYNIILVDWAGRSATRYRSAKSDVPNVGRYVAKVLQNLVENASLSLDNLYLLGHSLGAHAAGIVGSELGGKVATIVGMDAAAPFYGSEQLKNRLDPSDALFVQGIHASQGFLSLEKPYGHVDYFPNGGSRQPGCGIDLGGGCSHGRSNKYYAESISSRKFIGTKCENYTAYTKGYCNGNPTTIMGEWTPRSVSGQYYLTTNRKPPFARG